MFTRITFAAIAAALIVSAAPVLGGQSAGETITKVSKIAAQGWCSGPRQHTDFRCSWKGWLGQFRLLITKLSGFVLPEPVAT
jgi:hypothetical protein